MTDYLRREDIELHDRVDAQLYYDLSSFYFEEADLLDEGRYVDWLDLFDDDLFYWAPTRTNRLRRQQALSISEPGGLAFYDETRESLAWRIRRFDSGMAWAEDPPSRTRHLITNLRARHATDTEGNKFIEARTNFYVWRTRLEREQDTYVGTRTDLLRVSDQRLKVCDRRILLDINVLASKNISTFF
ncbi:aromatic-ring-hydroxylating dioxygenase subunit beta [Corynebacterium rouxii]|uniref:3-phenylpropionate/cinnamic acid dioxygenase subunit beta n=1 Tax=Corynebacterium rouxii TaxID=2719119 RepID=A0ABU3PPU2_9CORY|nr:3-phenylpropionate/cinnamic acid dioxygenase subunit beta [Corynebacterium rouxii]MDT9409593.1 3-phenylpropionate/cinnamic acid dioxygenase subunit beta [Corynebacterium rouxii]MDT9411826.1 3-phenylpropionate/cinnamic acid dioxygenase subunit beta [Corynebacterium rouxii]